MAIEHRQNTEQRQLRLRTPECFQSQFNNHEMKDERKAIPRLQPGPRFERCKEKATTLVLVLERVPRIELESYRGYPAKRENGTEITERSELYGQPPKTDCKVL